MRPGTQDHIVFDARCLQDPACATGDIARHARDLVAHRPRRDRFRSVAILDRALPELSASDARLFDHVTFTTRAVPAGGDIVFVSLAPMIASALRLSSYLRGLRTCRRAAVIHDTPPDGLAAPWAPSPLARLAWHTNLAWLRRYDRFGAISPAAARALGRTLSISADRITVTGAALRPAFHDVPTGRMAGDAGDVLVVWGDGCETDAACAVAAFAASAALGGARLIILGDVAPERAAELLALYRRHGGEAGRLVLQGAVADAQRVALYRDAACVVVPSRVGGSGLAVLEAMACHVPALASDIERHRELIPDPSCLFRPDDAASLGALMERALLDRAWRAGIVQGQETVWQRYRPEKVAERFWEPILAPPPLAAPAPLRGRRPLVAFMTPLPPDRSGVADYSAATCAELGRLVDLHVYAPTRRPAPVANAAAIAPLSAWPYVTGLYDRYVNVLGNSQFHFDIFKYMSRYGGASIPHDCRMLGFFSSMTGIAHASAIASKELGREVSTGELVSWLHDEARLEAMMLGDVVDASDPVIVHSAVTARLMRERYGHAPTYIPFSFYRAWRQADLRQRGDSRGRLGLDAKELIIVSLGFVHPSKAPEETIHALGILRAWGIEATLLFVGDRHDDPAFTNGLDTAVRKWGLERRVRFVDGYVSEAAYRDYLRAADIAIQLRTVGLGGLSGGLLDCIGAGVPTVTNAGLAEATGVPSYVASIPDRIAALPLAEAIAEQIDSDLPWHRREAERAAFCERRSMAAYARKLCAALEIEVGGPGCAL